MKKAMVIVALLACMAGKAQTFTLQSKDLGGQAMMKQVLNGFGCSGGNVSPELFWENAPAGTKSFAVTMYDQDAPTGSGWWHWLIFDLEKTCSELPADAGNVQKNIAPENAIQSRTDFGVPGYGGPCPPPGSKPHAYVITLYALDTEKLGLGANASPALVGFYLGQHTIQKASLVFYYQQ
ncbi:YbhB/YbcL family Raf kinase inhibitor-like protein [Panacibacter ginsenosidivorans]|uniref:YbhB/YbcL family Raf kinase inhibitor-like protein n=1 Tax=Panacibacter ginsenosidivorans TaxID=1813871 RepID=A0A5B8VG59_9BACT|nr:YbhB/YbcL family Raf kinase inhibitor-like protein [Panacibacter ginsenosidivorans]QEC69288.1 YbhB/YbcL family Raf kinase inhibitor-like protein [Panacibacter ginsenosidivorans]